MRKQVAGFVLPSDDPPTEIELAWMTFLRIIFDGEVPDLTLEHVQRLRMALLHPDSCTQG